MAYRDYKWPFILYTDASKKCLGLLLACIQDGREYIAAYSKRIFQPSKQNHPNSSSFRAGSVRSRACSSPAHLAQCPTASHGIGVCSTALLTGKSCLVQLPHLFPKGCPPLTPYLSSWKIFVNKWGSADRGLQATDLDSFGTELQTKISCLDDCWHHVIPERIQVLMPADIQSYLPSRFGMLLWTFQAKQSNKLNSLHPSGDTLKTTGLSLNRPLPQQMQGVPHSADPTRAVMGNFRHLGIGGDTKS